MTTSPDDSVYTFLRFQRVGCYGYCPAFTVEVLSNGEAYWQGLAYVERLGNYRAVAPLSLPQNILERAEAAGWWQLADSYPEPKYMIADLPSTKIVLRWNGEEKSVVDNHNAPQALQAFEKWLIAQLEELDWRKIP